MLGHTQCEFLEYWNTQKSVWRIWQRFSFLLDEGIPKKWKKLNSHCGFLRADQGNVLPDGLNWLCYFAGNSKSHRENSISFTFFESSHQVDMKIIVKSSKHFFGYFNTLETHSGKQWFYKIRVSNSNFKVKTWLESQLIQISFICVT